VALIFAASCSAFTNMQLSEHIVPLENEVQATKSEAEIVIKVSTRLRTSASQEIATVHAVLRSAAIPRRQEDIKSADYSRINHVIRIVILVAFLQKRKVNAGQTKFSPGVIQAQHSTPRSSRHLISLNTSMHVPESS
jgi:hypothetical protein